MKLAYSIFILAAISIISISCSQNTKNAQIMDHTNNPVFSKTDTSKVALSNDEWKKILSPEVYHIAREKGTERPYTSKYEELNDIGTYYCAVCGNALFLHSSKFRRSCG